MLERRGLHTHRADVELFTRVEIVELDVRLQGGEGHGERGSRHLSGENAFHSADIGQMTRLHMEGVVGRIGGREEREAVDVIPVGVRQEHRRLAHSALEEALAQVADAGARVEDDRVTVSADFEATGVAAVLDVIGRRARNRTADTPESNPELHQATLPRRAGCLSHPALGEPSIAPCYLSHAAVRPICVGGVETRLPCWGWRRLVA